MKKNIWNGKKTKQEIELERKNKIDHIIYFDKLNRLLPLHINIINIITINNINSIIDNLEEITSDVFSLVKYLYKNNVKFYIKELAIYACRTGNVDILEYLQNIVKYKKLNMSDDIVEKAIIYGHLDVVKFIHMNKYIISPYCICFAFVHGYLDIIKYLHENKYKLINITYAEYAAKHGHLDILKYLYENGLNFYGDKIYGSNIVTKAVQSGNFEVLKYVCDNGGDIKYDRKNALFIAIGRNYFKMAAYMCSLLADSNNIDSNNVDSNNVDSNNVDSNNVDYDEEDSDE
jgi:hypothetical protein